MTVGFDDPNLDIDPRQWLSSTGKYTVGYLYEWQGNMFWFVGVVDAALSAGDVVTWSTTSGYVTNDISGGSSAGTCVAGVAMSACPVGGYTFVQCSGVGLKDITTDGSVAAAEYLMAHASTDGGSDTMADGSEEAIFGIAMAADASTTLAAGKYIFKNTV